MLPRGVGLPGWDSYVRVLVACLDVLYVVVPRLAAPCLRPVTAHMDVGPSGAIFGTFIVNIYLI